jgi:hypothetical protein
MKSSTIALVVALSFYFVAKAPAQVAEDGVPYSFSFQVDDDIPAVIMPGIDLMALLAEDEIEEAEGMPFRFGAPFDIDLGLNNSGKWDTLSNGDRLWRIKIVCPGAYSTNLIYSRYWLPENARFYIYNEDKSTVLGAFTARNNKEHGKFATGLLRGDACILEYNEPGSVNQPGRIDVSRVVHGYKDILAGFGDSGSCNNNVNCPVLAGKKPGSLCSIMKAPIAPTSTGPRLKRYRDQLAWRIDPPLILLFYYSMRQFRMSTMFTTPVGPGWILPANRQSEYIIPEGISKKSRLITIP